MVLLDGGIGRNYSTMDASITRRTKGYRNMRKNVNYLAKETLLALVEASGLPVKEQSGFVRVEGADGKRLYISRTKRVGRVDLSGFTVEGPGFRQLDEDEKFCRVTCQLDFGAEEKVVLAAFKTALKKLVVKVAAKVAKGKADPKTESKEAAPGLPEATTDEAVKETVAAPVPVVPEVVEGGVASA